LRFFVGESSEVDAFNDAADVHDDFERSTGSEYVMS
jgi:hypothetical protein